MGIKAFFSKLLGKKQEAPVAQRNEPKRGNQPQNNRKRYYKKDEETGQEVWRPGAKVNDRNGSGKNNGERRKPQGERNQNDRSNGGDRRQGERKQQGEQQSGERSNNNRSRNNNRNNDRNRNNNGERRPNDQQRSDRPRRERPEGENQQGERQPREQRERKPRPELPPYDASTHIVEPEEGKTRFHDLGLPDDIMHALQDLEFKYCTPIQAETLPSTLQGKDAFGKAQTGTGKTAAFLLQMFTKFLNEPLTEQRRRGTPRGLILAPTRELAIQIKKDADSLAKYTRLRTVAVYGGMDYNKQQKFLERYVDLVVATPGRLLDFQRNKVVDLRKVEVLVIDEADRMLDMGFIPDVKKIVYATPHKERRQTLLFSATLNEDVTRLAASWMTDPIQVEIAPESVATATVDQKVFVCTDDQKFTMLYNTLKRDDMNQCIIFTNRRDQAERLSDQLRNYGIDTFMLSGSVPQKRRLRILEDFTAGKKQVLVATDVAGRGIHVNAISHVVNYNIPQNPEDYVHRIGRTGRAGSTGTSITFACEMESFEIPAIEELLGETLACERPTDDMLKELPEPTPLAREHSDRREGEGHHHEHREGGHRHGNRRHEGQRNRSECPNNSDNKVVEAEKTAEPVEEVVAPAVAESEPSVEVVSSEVAPEVTSEVAADVSAEATVGKLVEVLSEKMAEKTNAAELETKASDNDAAPVAETVVSKEPDTNPEDSTKNGSAE